MDLGNFFKTSSSQNDGQEGDIVAKAWKFDQEQYRKALARMVIMDEKSYRFVEHEGFREFCNLMQPKFRFISRSTVARDWLELYIIEKEKLKETLANSNQRIYLTTDCRAVESCMLQWGIEKVFTITVDNASSNDTAVSNLKKRISKRNGFVLDGEFFHVRCCAHIVNLIVRDGIEEVKDSISRIRSVVRYIRNSPQRSQQFKICREQERIPSKSSLCLDVATRWSYTYLMLETALKFQKAFERLEEQNSHFVADLKDGVPNEMDWDYARILVKFLKKFYDVTKRLSGSLYVTSNSYFHEVCSIEKHLSDWSRSNDLCLSGMAKIMKEKFDKYWGNIDKMNMMLLVAIVLDPRYKLKYVKFCYSRLYAKEKVDMLDKRVKDFCNDVYKHYQILDSTSTSPLVRMTQFSSEMEVDPLEEEVSLQHKFLKHLEEEENCSSISEVERYLEESIEKDVGNFEILKWWKMNCSKYRLLSQMTRDVLAIPVSTIASESAFSTGGRIVDQFRSSLTPKLVDCVVCTQDWLRASPLPIGI